MKKSGSRHVFSPVGWLAISAAYAALLIAGVIFMAAKQPWLGLTFSYDRERDAAIVMAAEGPAAGVPIGAVITEVGSETERIRLQARDFIPETDGVLETYAVYDAFLERQSALAKIQAGPVVELRDAAGASWQLAPERHRPVRELPAAFWVQLAVGVIAWLISAAVWVFRRDDAAARYLLLSGWATAVFSPMAGVYSTRELAMDGTWFRWLSDLNFMGGSVFAGTLVALLTVYPRRVGPAWLGPVAVAAQAAWFAAQQVGVFESMIFARRMLVMVALAGTFGLAAWHWRATRRDPVARAALRWFLISWLVGSGVFVLLILLPQMFGLDTSALQGYAFLLFVLVYAGLAFGILRFRLFGLDEWWARVVTWLAAVALLVALDLLFLLQLRFSGGLSLSLSLLICGLVWLPLRGWLSEKILGRARGGGQVAFRSVVDVALTPRPEERDELWLRCLRETFDPLRIEPAGRDSPRAEILGDGQALLVPGVGELPSQRLEYARGGRTLFSPRDAATADELANLLRHVMAGRDAYERGVSVERGRIARDIHDNIGAQLLNALHSREERERENALRGALADLRGIINDTANPDQPLDEALADLRHETSERLAAGGVRLEWNCIGDAGPRASARLMHALRPMLRESINNVLKHARASIVRVAVRVDMEADAEGLRVSIEDDGVGFDPALVRHGHGLANLHARASALGGRVTCGLGKNERGARVDIWFPTTLLDRS